MMNTSQHRPLVLAGYPGSGKTTVGAILAVLAGRAFFDGDVGIEASSQMSVADIFKTDGEAGFRKYEFDLYHALPLSPCLVLAVGGGTFLNPELRGYFEARANIICLVVEPETAWQRLQQSHVRPLLSGTDGLMKIREMWQERNAHYSSFTNRIDTTSLTPEQCVNRIMAMFGIIRRK